MAISPIWLFSAITILIIILVIIIVVMDYQLKKRKALQRDSLEYRFTKKFQALKMTDMKANDKINAADKLARELFAEKYNLITRADYSQLAELFAKNGKMHIVPFCQIMTEILYSGNEAGQGELKTVMNSLESMFTNDKVLISIGKEDLDEDKNNLIRIADKIENKIEEFKKDMFKKNVETHKIEPAKKENLIEDIKEEVEIIPKQTIAVPKDIVTKTGKGKKDRAEYKYIGSLDMLDRIENKIKKNKEETKNK